MCVNIAHTTHLISQFSTWWVRLFPETFPLFLLPLFFLPLHIHFLLFFFLWFPFLQHFLFGTRRRETFHFHSLDFFDKLFIIGNNKKCVFKSLMIAKSKREYEREEIFQGVVRNPFSRVAIYLWRIKSWREKNLKQIKINFDRVENECERARGRRKNIEIMHDGWTAAAQELFLWECLIKKCCSPSLFCCTLTQTRVHVKNVCKEREKSFQRWWTAEFIFMDVLSLYTRRRRRYLNFSLCFFSLSLARFAVNAGSKIWMKIITDKSALISSSLTQNLHGAKRKKLWWLLAKFSCNDVIS